MAQAGEGVAEQTVGARGVERGIAGEQRELEMGGELAEEAIESGVVAQAVAGELDEDVLAAESGDELPREGFGLLAFFLEKQLR